MKPTKPPYDMGAEFAKAKNMADVMDTFIRAIEQNQPQPAEYDCICQDCGRRAGTMRLTIPPKDGFVLVRCFDCSAGDKPTEWPDTGWGL